MVTRPTLDAVEIRGGLLLNHHPLQGRASRHVPTVHLDHLEDLCAKGTKRDGGIEVTGVRLVRGFEREEFGVEAPTVIHDAHEHVAMIGRYEKSAFHTRR